jgi:hypothetical protein
MSLVLNCKTTTQPFVYVNTLFFLQVWIQATKIVLKLRTLLIGAIGHGGHRVTATDCATAGEWVIFFCEIRMYQLLNIDTEDEFRSDLLRGVV